MIGTHTAPRRFDIEKGQIRRFAQAIGERDRIHLDEAAAHAAGFASLVAPPTFPAALSDLPVLLHTLGIDEQAVMHAEEEYEYFRPICAGDVISVVHCLVDSYSKSGSGNDLTFHVFETRGTDAQKRLVFKARRVLVERKTS